MCVLGFGQPQLLAAAQSARLLTVLFVFVHQGELAGRVVIELFNGEFE